MHKKINIGLDIGVTSVGWSIIDNDYKIIDMGVRLFDDPANPKNGTLGNEKRRSSRSKRRMIRRTKLRKRDLISFLIKNNFGSKEEIQNIIENFDITKYGFDHPAQLKQKALTNKITREELIFLLFHYIHHRGYFYVTEKDIENEFKTKKSDDFPSIQMVEFFNKNKYFSYQNANNERFSNNAWEKEIRKVLETQKCDIKLIEEYLVIFKRIRKFEEGPGSEKSPTKFGLYRYEYNKNTHKHEITNNGYNKLWDYTIGRCTWYQDQKRGFKNSPIAELFNLFNDINNIYLINNHDRKLLKEEKDRIFNELSKSFFQKKSINLSRKVICNIINKINTDNNFKSKDVCGCRVDQEKKQDIFTKLENYYILGSWIKKYKKNFNNKQLNVLDIDFLNCCNELFEKLAHEQDIIKRIRILSNEDEFKTSSKDENENIIKKMKGLSATHSLSNKAMLEFIEYCIKHLDESKNQQQFYIEVIKLKLKENDTCSKNNNKYLKHGMFDNEILSPTVKRAFNQAVLVFNKILKVYRKYDINNIVIELPRDKNSFEQKQKIDKLNKENEKLISKLIDDETDINLEKLSATQKIRLKLWHQQERKDIYDNSIINLNDVISGKNLDIDHIIPISISHDNSLNNKVLTKTINNSSKKNLTPYFWLSKTNAYSDFENRVNDLYSKQLMSEEKMKNLLYKNDPLNDLFHYIGRNLTDTRYASSLIMHQFKNFFDNNTNYQNVKVKVIRGAITNFARYNLFIDNHQDKKTLLPKNRDLYCHHAIDASIVCFLGMNNGINQMLNFYHTKCMSNNDCYDIDNESRKMINRITGEVINFNEFFDMHQISIFGNELAKYNDTNESLKNKIHFSRGINTKNNISLADETIYSYNDMQKIYYSQLDLFKEKTGTLNKYFLDENSEEASRLLIKKYNYHLFKKLKDIYCNYSNVNKNDKNNSSSSKINPFKSYMTEEYNIDTPSFVLIENNKIKKLRLCNKINSGKVILSSHNNKAIMQSLNCLSWRIYKDNDNKFVVFPIDVNVIKNIKKCNTDYLTHDDRKINDVLITKNIETNKFISIYRGTIIVDKNNNDIFYISGAKPTANIFEIKWLNGINKKHPNLKNKSDGRYTLTVNSIATRFDIAQIDPLGRIYNRCSFEEKYNKN